MFVCAGLTGCSCCHVPQFWFFWHIITLNRLIKHLLLAFLVTCMYHLPDQTHNMNISDPVILQLIRKKYTYFYHSYNRNIDSLLASSPDFVWHLEVLCSSLINQNTLHIFQSENKQIFWQKILGDKTIWYFYKHSEISTDGFHEK